MEKPALDHPTLEKLLAIEAALRDDVFFYRDMVEMHTKSRRDGLLRKGLINRFQFITRRETYTSWIVELMLQTNRLNGMSLSNASFVQISNTHEESARFYWASSNEFRYPHHEGGHNTYVLLDYIRSYTDFVFIYPGHIFQVSRKSRDVGTKNANVAMTLEREQLFSDAAADSFALDLLAALLRELPFDPDDYSLV